MSKVAVITGSTSGIGLGIAKKLAAQGFKILINGRSSAEESEAIIKELKSISTTDVYYSDADVSKPEEIHHMILSAEKNLGPVDVLVNNAGIQHTSLIEDFPDDKWNAILAINLSAVFHGIKAVIPSMKQRNTGRIINIASTHGLVASKNKAAYVAAKHGVLGLTKTVALELASYHITCNAICPGWVLTPLVERQIQDIAAKNNLTYDAAKEKLLSEKQPTLRFIEPNQIGDMVLFLHSPAASGITGSIFTMDGGWTAQ